jgi:hypothetical protein
MNKRIGKSCGQRYDANRYIKVIIKLNPYLVIYGEIWNKNGLNRASRI